MATAATAVARIYRWVWWSIATPAALAGVAAACLSLRLGALLLGGVVAGLTAFFGWQLSTMADEQQPAPRSVAGNLLALSALGGVTVLAGAGLVLALGGPGCLVAVVIAAGGWPLLRRARRGTVRRTGRADPGAAGPAPKPVAPSGRRGPSTAPTPPTPPTPPTAETSPADGLPGPSSPESLSTAQLCWAWRLSYLQVRRATCGAELERLAQLRRGYLEELERRDHQAFASWLPTARAAGDPGRIFCPPGASGRTPA
jgi:hypothetical protein